MYMSGGRLVVRFNNEAGETFLRHDENWGPLLFAQSAA